MTPELEQSLIATLLEIKIQERKLEELKERFQSLSAASGHAKFKLRLEPVIEEAKCSE